MFYTLLAASLVEAVVVCFVLATVLGKPVELVMRRLVGEEIYTAWTKYVRFAIYVVGIGGGVEVYRLERYVSGSPGKDVVVLTTERWVLELYRTLIGTLQSVAWMLLVFFVFALIAYVIVRGSEMKRGGGPVKDT